MNQLAVYRIEKCTNSMYFFIVHVLVDEYSLGYNAWNFVLGYIKFG